MQPLRIFPQAREIPAETGRNGDSQPTVRLHIWLETGSGTFFGAGRAQLLARVEELGSLKKAAASMGMSYRAAWGKIQQSEKELGVKLLKSSGNRREGLRLTKFARVLVERFETWFAIVEQEAVHQAEEIFPFRVRCFHEKSQE
jgi:molybdate transport system regulatory protein